MLRLGQVVAFPLVEGQLKPSAPLPHRVLPFQGYREVIFQDYSFFIRNEFQSGAAASGARTGVYCAPVTSVFPGSDRMARYGEDFELEVSLHVYEPVPLAHLGQIHREHIRWVAMAYKQALIRTQQTYVLRNKLYLKKMNLSNDLAAWVCWELFLQDKQTLTVVVMLRRQYLPPLVDSVQDFAVILKCPASAMAEGRTKGFQEDLIHEAHIMADSLSPRAQSAGLYPDVIQAKLDALLYDEEAYGWIRSRLKLRPDGEARLEQYACVFVKGILKILRDENALLHPELWDEASRRVASVCGKKSEQDLDPMVVAQHSLRHMPEGPHGTTADEQAGARMNAWHARVAQYLAYCVDGGLFGSKFTLADIISNLQIGKVEQFAQRRLGEVLAFLLHLRPKDLAKAWEPKALPSQLLALGLLSSDAGKEPACSFNDRVMQAMLEMGYLQRLLAPRSGQGSISTEYAHLLKYLMQCDGASVNLKASICRQIVAAKDAEQGPTLCDGLVALLRTGGPFLATYACAALVNLSQAKEVVKNFLVHNGIGAICMQQLRSKDDDLILYTLMLLVHLSKFPYHRLALLQCGLVPLLYEILSASYGVLQYKRRILTELCSVLGQMCNDEDTRLMICRTYQYVIDCLLSVFESAEQWPGNRRPGDALPPASAKILSKVLFALKQLCANSVENKELVGSRVIKALMSDLQTAGNLEEKDWANNALLLLLILAISSYNRALIEEAGWADTHAVLCASPLGKLFVTRDRIQLLDDRLTNDYHD